MVTTKFIIEVVLVVLSLAVVLWWIYTNFSSLSAAFTNWLQSLVG
jgi:hypothetical protein